MTTITREQAQKIIEAADEVISALAGTNEDVNPGSDNMLRLWDDLNDRHAPPEVVRELARIALASLEADPVAYIFKHPAGKLFWALTDESNKEQADVIPVYAAAPASVVPDNASEPLAYAYKELTPEIMRNHLAVFERYGIAPNDSSTTIQALRIALTSLEAEPVAWQVTITKDGQDSASTIYRDCAEKDTWVRIHEKLGSVVHVTPLYMAPPAPVMQADVAQAIENLKQKLVECNRYNYCADAVKNVEDASRVLALQNQNMSAPITPEAIENAIEYIRSIAFHIDEDDYHGKHIAYFMRQALAWLEGHSCSADSQGKSDNSPLPRYQVIELTMLVKQLVSQLKKAKPDCKLPDRAMDYLLRNGLVSAEGV